MSIPHVLVSLLLLIVAVAGQSEDARELRSGLSSEASIDFSTSKVPRWSEYNAPHPAAVVNVATERDVQVTVQYCVKKSIPFLVQNGGNGWADTFHLGKKGVVINMHALNKVSFSADKKQVTIGGGTLASDLYAAGYANGVHIQTPGCPCLGVLGAYLGGGYSDLVGQLGLGIDNLLSLDVVLADGSRRTVTPKDADLWWAMRGAGPNFGVVTSAVVKAFPVPPAEQISWQGQLFFESDKIEAVTAAINDLKLSPRMSLFAYFGTTGPPSFTPAFFLRVFYLGTEAAGRAAFKPILALEPYMDTTAVVRYDHWGDGATYPCIKGGRKPSYGASFTKMVPSIWRAIWNEYVAFVKIPGTGGSTVLMEHWPLSVIGAVPESSSAFPLRKYAHNAVVTASYNDTALDKKAEAFGSKVRGLMWATDGAAKNLTYVNFAHGGEDLSQVYGDNVPRLKKIKARYDPKGVFDQWFSLS